MTSGITIRPLKELYFRTPMYTWRLNRLDFKEIETAVPDFWPGEAEVGRGIINGIISGVKVADGQVIWQIKPEDPLSLESLQGFSWLRHLKAQGGEAARTTARRLVGSWLDLFNTWHYLYWRVDILGERISAWLGMYDFFCESASDTFRIAVHTSIRKQTAHGLMDISSAEPGIKKIRAIKGLILASLAFGLDNPSVQILQKTLREELENQVYPDGGHLSRSPSTHIEVIMALIDIRNAFRASGKGNSEDLQEVIGRMASMLRLWRHSDGKLALFHNTQENGKPLIESIIGQSESRRKILYTAPNTGFQKLSGGASNVIIDNGNLDANKDVSHRSITAFEFSVGKQRLIVNCGTSPGNLGMREALKSSVAHSMLTIDNADAISSRENSHSKKEMPSISFNRKTVDGVNILEIVHDGYRFSHGLMHQRTFYLSENGEDFRGEERLIYSGDPGANPSKAIVRFHLHPRVRASIVQNGSSIILRPNSGGVWRFKTDALLNIEESLYLGTAVRQKTEQIVITKLINGIRDSGDIYIKWSIRREDGLPSSGI